MNIFEVSISGLPNRSSINIGELTEWEDELNIFQSVSECTTIYVHVSSN